MIIIVVVVFVASEYSIIMQMNILWEIFLSIWEILLTIEQIHFYFIF
jgi:hypothetical protein